MTSESMIISIGQSFAELPDPRQDINQEHKFIDQFRHAAPHRAQPTQAGQEHQRRRQG
jgi:hypothetical protein